MRNGDGFSARTETGGRAVPAPRSCLSLLLAPQLPARQPSEGHGHPVPGVPTSRTLAKPEEAEAAQSWLRGAARKGAVRAVAAAPSGLVGRLKLWIRRVR